MIMESTREAAALRNGAVACLGVQCACPACDVRLLLKGIINRQ